MCGESVNSIKNTKKGEWVEMLIKIQKIHIPDKKECVGRVCGEKDIHISGQREEYVGRVWVVFGKCVGSVGSRNADSHHCNGVICCEGHGFVDLAIRAPIHIRGVPMRTQPSVQAADKDLTRECAGTWKG